MGYHGQSWGMGRFSTDSWSGELLPSLVGRFNGSSKPSVQSIKEPSQASKPSATWQTLISKFSSPRYEKAIFLR